MLSSLSKQLILLAKRSDLVLAVIVLVAIIIMIIPLPPTVVDILIALNISVSVLILLIGLSVFQPTEFSTLPSVILIATLFRLAITITTSRLILLNGTQTNPAGEIVTAFGDFVVGGNVAVGLIIFLIITTAQFLVITKGSERVAEVAARFTLDALPGKQMSIDSDLKNGDIDQAEARRLRKNLERESQLYGAMDGAMKFVKGDAMAGLVIILVNLVGGLAIGTLQMGLDTSTAIHQYSLLSVGDGLVAQLPALLVSVAAGTVITRVSAEEQGDLGAEVIRQLFGQGRALIMTAVVLAFLALMPGFPAYVLLILSAMMGALGVVAHRSNKTLQQQAFNRASHPSSAVEKASGSGGAASASDTAKAQPKEDEFLQYCPITIRLGNSLCLAITPDEMKDAILGAQSRLFDSLGVDSPAVMYQIDHSFADKAFVILLDEVPVVQGEIEVDCLLVEHDSVDMEFLSVPHRKTKIGFWKFDDAYLVDKRYEDTLLENGIGYYKPVDLLSFYLFQMLERYAHQFIEIQDTRNRLAEIEKKYPDLSSTLNKNIELPKINEVLKRLVEEKISIRNLRSILEVLAEWAYREKDVVLLVEYVRAALARQICFQVAQTSKIIPAYVLERKLEEAIRNAVRPTTVGAYLVMPEEITRPIIDQIEKKMQLTSPNVPQPVILAAMDIRRHVRNLLVRNGIDLHVLSYQEIAPEFSIQTLASIQTTVPSSKEKSVLPNLAEA